MPSGSPVLVTRAASGLGAATVAVLREVVGRPLALDPVPADGRRAGSVASPTP